MRSRNNLSAVSQAIEQGDNYRARVAALPFPLIALIILLMVIAKYFG